MAMALERRDIDVQGTPIDSLSWGRRGAPGLLLMHGNGAHAEWFSFIAPLLADRYRVTAMSFSGMGRSGRREAYGVAQWADEALAVAEACGLFDATVKPLFAAHSFGCFALMSGAARYGQRLAGAVLIDGPPQRPPGESSRSQRHAEAGFKPSKIYHTMEAALARFRFAPLQGCEHLYIVDHIARSSLKAVVDAQGQPGFTWLTDPLLFKQFSFGQPMPDLGQARCPVTLMRGSRSRLITPELFAQIARKAPPGSRQLELPDADHHLMADQPLAFAQMLAELRG